MATSLSNPAVYKNRLTSASCFLVLAFVCLFNLAAFSQAHPAVDDEFVGPFASWLNVKTVFGAMGDGMTDDTRSLQAAFDAIGNANSTASVVYLPAGTYRVTAKLTMNYKMNVSIIGEDPSTTIIKWAGAAGGTIMQVSGTAYSRFNRITWDGNATASNAVDQSFNGSQGYFDTGNEYADDVFANVGTGIRGGFLGNGFAETAIMRCTFLRNTVAGVSLGNFNAIDAWVWNSLFQDCNIGITNIYGAGNFQVYNSVFRNSTTSDISIDNTGLFAFRDNMSINSRAFITTTLKRYPAPITIQSNIILDPVNTAAITIRNHGPVSMIDNVVRSRAGATGAVVIMGGDPSSELFCLDNVFTVADAVSSSSRKILYNKPVVSRESLQGIAEKMIPGTQPNFHRKVLEVPAGAGSAEIQNVVNDAAALAGSRPVVHFAHGTYLLNSTVVIPAGSDLQLTGDGDGDVHPTWLKWTGTGEGPVLQLEGPSKATIRDLSINGNNLATNIRINNADQDGSRVFMHEVEAHLNKSNLLVNGLDNTLVLAQNSRFSSSTRNSVKVTGGPFALSGNPHAGRTVIYAGLAFDNAISHEVNDGGNLLTRDIWYESSSNGTYLKLPSGGLFTSEGCRVASPTGTTVPVMNISDFNGKVTFVNLHIDDRIAVSGNGTGSRVLGLGVQSKGTTYLENNTNPAGDVRGLNGRIVQDPNTVFPRSGSRAAPNVGTADSLFIAGMLQQGRNIHSAVLAPTPSGSTDIRMYRVWSYYSDKAIEINPGVSGATAGLINLVMTEAAFTPAFNPDSLSYNSTVALAVSSVTFTPTTNDANAVITINNQTANSGTVSAPVPVNAGWNTISVKVTNGASARDYLVHVYRGAGVTFAGKIFLQACYNSTTGMMRNTLNTSGVLQNLAVNQPYSVAPFDYPGTEQVPLGFFSNHPDIVDWVLVELKNSMETSAAVFRRAAFVHTNGTITEVDGTNDPLHFPEVSPGQYYVSVKHRNHLGIRSFGLVDFTGGSATYDFTDNGGRVYQSMSYPSTTLSGTAWCMRGGNANSNSNVRYNGPANDQDRIQNFTLLGSISSVLTNRYSPDDINMDGVIKTNGPANDQDFLLNVILGGLLSNVLFEQL